MPRPCIALVIASILSLAASESALASMARFTPILLGTLPGGDYSQALVVNDRGQVAGFSSSSRSPEQAFGWAPGIGMVAIGSFGALSATPVL